MVHRCEAGGEDFGEAPLIREDRWQYTLQLILHDDTLHLIVYDDTLQLIA
jgi:hypothetical protein